jgi:CubicO group peptidase (beta-lactamase class C family)
MRRALAALLVALPLAIPTAIGAQSDFITIRFERYLEALRKQAGMPGLSAAIVQDDQIVWEAGFGYQDVEASVRASPDTPYYVADLTGILSATLVLQCVEQGRITLDTPVVVPSALPLAPVTTATVGQLLRHSPGGAAFSYDAARFSALTNVVAQCMDDSFKEAVARRVLDVLAMTRSVPGTDVLDAAVASDFDNAQLLVYQDVLLQIAKPYRLDRRGRASPSQYPAPAFNAATGLVTTVRDLASFAIGLDTQTLLGADALAAAWSVPPGAVPQTFGLGWFVQVYNGQPVVWHFGYAPDASSALFIHLPARHKTLILLANSDGLAATFSLAAGDVTVSPFARLFLSLFG